MLLVEHELVVREAIAAILGAEGARVTQAATSADGLVALSNEPPDVMLVDLRLRAGDGDGTAFLAQARDAGSVAPAIAMTTLGPLGPAVQQARARFDKILRMPFEIGDLIVAIASLATSADARLALRQALQRSNAPTQYRFTSFFRFDGEDLTSVWSYDRENPAADDFPLDMTVEGSYCRDVRAANAPFVVVDSQADARVKHHPKRNVLRAYCGVPVRDAAGRPIGALCHFDAVPHAMDANALAALEREARRIEVEVHAEGLRRRRIG